ncbi:MAG: menaquinone biosynthesis protein [Pirellulaceae bacterium]|jgi:chorismate dehydratase|nr:menaquinone biosynthesis protein [Pirellulaceae bacterium]
MSVSIGAVSYLNTKPLIFGLQQQLDCQLRLDLPSRLADDLAARKLDVALIPSVEFLRGRQFSIVSDACIACRGPVRSVRVLFRKPPQRARSLALDEGSRTSAVLAQVLLARRYNIRPSLQSFKIDAAVDSVQADAVLMIGDRAMNIDTSAYVADWDLGEEWTRETGLPFVFAMWVAAGSQIPAEVSQALQRARDAGLAHIDSIVAAEAPRYGLTATDCRAYFLEQLHFTLGPRELAGLDLFRQWAIDLQLLPATSQPLVLAPL